MGYETTTISARLAPRSTSARCSGSSSCSPKWDAMPSAPAPTPPRHSPPAPELLDLTDKMGFLVMDEAFDQWARQKTTLDYHLLYADWHEQDLRALIRRDRHHPSVVMWSIGNEVGEQAAAESGAGLARELTAICHEED